MSKANMEVNITFKRADTIIVIGGNYAQAVTWAEELVRILGLPKRPKVATFTNLPNLAGYRPETTTLYFVGEVMDRWTRGGYWSDQFDAWRTEMVALGFEGGTEDDIRRLAGFERLA